jgi:hypothetical protein
MGVRFLPGEVNRRRCRFVVTEMRSPRRGWLRAAGPWVVCLPLVACSPALTISGPAPEAPPPVWDAGDPICLVQPVDWRSGTVVYAGSGVAIANGIARQLAERQAKVVRVVGERRPFESCATSRTKYVVVPVILDWERQRGFFVNRVRVKLHLSLLHPGGEKALRTVDFVLEDAKPNVIFFSPPQLPPKQLDDAVLRLLSPVR